jgi:hypothetical protein
VLYVGLLASTWRALGRVRRHTRLAPAELPHLTATALQAGLAAFMVTVVFVSATQQKLFWLAVFLSMCLPALVSRQERLERRREEAQPAPGPWAAARAS